jgi:hypothetical protein
MIAPTADFYESCMSCPFCRVCKGTGRVDAADGTRVDCAVCKGEGVEPLVTCGYCFPFVARPAVTS